LVAEALAFAARAKRPTHSAAMILPQFPLRFRLASRRVEI